MQQLQAQRDPYKYPFAKNSIWNMPIHNSASYVPAGILPGTGWGVVYDQEVIVNTPTSPSQTIFTNAWATTDRCSQIGPSIGSVNVPNSYITPFSGSTPNMSAALLQSDGHTYFNTQPFHRCVASGPAYSKFTFASSDLYGDGIAGSHGGSQMSAVGGSIRVGELVPGGVIRHAVKVDLWEHYLSYNNDATRGYRWPALRADACASTCYIGSNTAMEMGALLALPPSFNVNSLNTEPGRILAKAMQDYGAYVVDITEWDVTALCVAEGPDGSVVDNFATDFGFPFNPSATSTCTDNGGACLWSKDIATIFSNLNVVNNNDANNIGGGPTTDFTNRRVASTCDPTGTLGSGSWCNIVNIPVTGVSVNPTSATVEVGSTPQLIATVSPSNASNQIISWSSSNTNVATVNQYGVVTTLNTGSATITVTTQDGSKTATCNLTVTAAATHTNIAPSGTGIIWQNLVNSPDNNTNTNNTKVNDNDLSTDINFTDATVAGYWQAAGVTWSTPQSNITSVKFYNGLCTSLATNGVFSSQIKMQQSTDGTSWTDVTGWAVSPAYPYSTAASNTTYTFSGVAINNVKGIRVIGQVRTNGSYSVHVKEVQVNTSASSNVPVTSVSVSPTSASIAIGATTNLTATISPSNATNQSVTWSSSNTGIATVNSSGVVTGVAAGSATVTVTTTDGAKTATSTITVTNAGTNIGETTLLSTTDNSNSTCFHTQQITLTQALTINSLSIYCQAAGGNVILAIYDNLSGKPNSLKAQTAAFTPVAGQWNTQNVQTPVSLAAGTYWIGFQCSSDAFTTYFSSTGGTSYSKCSHTYGTVDATFPTGTSNTRRWNMYGTFSSSGNVAVTGVTVSPSSATILVGSSTTLTATVAPSNATNQAVSWSSSNTGIATVNSSGVVTGVASGSATITVTTTDGGKTATSVITVNSPTLIGQTTLLTTTDNSNSTCFHTQQITLSQTLTINKLSIYCQAAGGNVILAIYDNLNGKPNNLKAQTAAFSPLAGQWNTQNVQTQVSLAAGTYWIGFQCSSDAFTTYFSSTGGTSYSKCSHTYGTVDATFPTGTSNTRRWNMYGTFSSSTVLSRSINLTGQNGDFKSEIKIYPNPVFNNRFRIITEGIPQEKTIQVYDALGRILFSKKLPKGEAYDINLKKVKVTGTCVVKIITDLGKVSLKVIQIQ